MDNSRLLHMFQSKPTDSDLATSVETANTISMKTIKLLKIKKEQNFDPQVTSKPSIKQDKSHIEIEVFLDEDGIDSYDSDDGDDDIPVLEDGKRKYPKIRNNNDTESLPIKCEKIVCDLCDKSFSSHSSLKGHVIAIHQRLKPFKCKICGMAYSHLKSLYRHNLIHTDARPYLCTQCGASFRDISHYHRHQDIHTNTKKFHCETCGMSFRRKHHLTQHSHIHTGEKPLGCTYCIYRCRQSTQLVTHMRRHHTHEYPHICEFCGRGFVTLAETKTHAKRCKAAPPAKVHANASKSESDEDGNSNSNTISETENVAHDGSNTSENKEHYIVNDIDIKEDHSQLNQNSASSNNLKFEDLITSNGSGKRYIITMPLEQ